MNNIGSDELVENLFRISLIKQKNNNENIKGEKSDSDAHYEVGSTVRDTIKKVGKTMPEAFPTLKKSLKQLEKEYYKIIETQVVYVF